MGEAFIQSDWQATQENQAFDDSDSKDLWYKCNETEREKVFFF